MDNLYEADIKELILNKRHIFLQHDYTKSTVLFEKGIVVGSTFADCLIFSEEGILGVEIKTSHDNVRRLNKQLNHYSLVCDRVYVMTHDNHVEKVENILSKHGHSHVGIIAYTEFRGKAILGIYKKASKSPKKKVQMAYQMLWKDEISQLLGSFKRQVGTLNEFGVEVEMAKSRSQGLHGLYTKSNSSRKYLTKTQMINMIVSRLGEEEANRLLCDIFINGRMHPEKNLKFYHFKKQ